MKKKTKKPKDELINSLLEDLKDQSPEDILRSESQVSKARSKSRPFQNDSPFDDLGEGSAKHDIQGDETALVDTTSHLPGSSSEFFVSDETMPIQSAIKGMVDVPSVNLSLSSEKKPLSVELEETFQLSIDSLNDANGGAKGSSPAKIESSDSREKKTPSRSSEAFGNFELPEPHANKPASTPSSRGPLKPSSGPPSAFENQFSRAENLKVAQQRILELEQDIEKYRKENEMLGSANEIAKSRMEDLITKTLQLEKQKIELKELNESELRIFKDGLVSKDSEIHRLKNKVDELESRLANDLRKVRVRERELENRLELAKVEKTALLRAKDETILELKRKTENLQAEVENYQNKIIEMGQKIEANQEQFARTVRALRLALTNLEVNEATGTSITLTPMKKAD